MADIVINPAIGKIDFFTTKGDNVTNTLKLTGNTLLVTGPLSASSISTGGGGAFVTSTQPTANYLSKFTSNSTIANSLIYDNGTNVGIGTTSPGAKLAIIGTRLTDPNNDSQSREIFYAVGRTVASAAGSTTLLGYLTPTGRSDHATIEIYHHDCGTIEYIRYELVSAYYVGTTTDWVQLPTINNISYTGALGGVTVDARLASTAANIELRLRSLGDSCGNMSVYVSIKSNCTFTEQSTTGTGGTVAGLLCNNAYQFPVGANRFEGTTSRGLYITNAGNVGIGTQSPAYKLDVSGNARFTSDTFVNGNLMVSKAGANLYINGSNSDAEIHWQANGTSRWAMGMNVGDATENLNIYNYTTSTTNFTILKANGNVGIGSTAPAFKLDVNGSIAVSGYRLADFNTYYNRIFEPAGNTAIWVGNASDPGNYYDNTNHSFRNRGGSTTYAYINSNGNLGVGTTSPSYKIDVVGAVRSTIDNDFGFVLKRSATNVWTGLGYYTANNSKWFVGLRETGDDNLRWYNYTNSAERMVLTEAGSLGVGTTSPGTKLDVVGEITTPVIKQSATLYSGTDITDDNSTRTVYFNIPAGGYSPPKYFKVARIKITGNYQNVSLNGYFSATNSTGLHVGSERKIEFDFIAYAATNPGAPIVTYLKRGPDTTTVLVYAVPNGGGAGTTYYDVYIRSAWYNDTNGELAVRVGYSSAVTIWQAGLDSGTSAPTDTLVNPNSNYSFDTSGNIGIGTTSPAYKLDVYGPVSLRGTRVLTTGFDIFGGLTYDIYGNIRVLRSDSAQADGMYIGYGGSGGPLRFFSNTGVQEFMTIATTGNVGIGSTSPAHRLDVVSGSIRASSGAYAGELYFGTISNADLYLKRDNGYDLSLVQNASSGNALYLAGAGNVYLSIDSNNNETDRAFIVQNNSIKSGTELFRVNEAGSVGIGTSSPGYKLDVGAVGSNSVSVRLTPGYERVRYYGFDLLGYNDGNLWMIGNNATNALILGSNWDWDSQIAIAYTPGTYGASGGSLEIGQVTKNNANFTHGNTRFYTNGIERLRIISSGNVGVGTTSPTAKFQVGTHSTGDAGNGDNSANVRIGAASAGARVFGMTLANTAAATLSNESALSFVLAGNYSATGIISALLRNTGNAATDLIFTNYNSSLQERMRILYDGNIGIGTSAPAYKLDVSGTGFASSDFRAPIFYDSANTTYYVDPASTSNLVGLTVANTITGNITGNAGGNAAGSSTFVASLGSNINYDSGSRLTKRAGLSHYSGYSTGTNRPTTFDYTLQVTDGNKGWEISMDWIATTGPAIYARSLRDCCQNWSTWVRILDSANYTYAANMNQYVRTTDNVTHNIVDATQFRDSANTSYYLDPASTSVLNYLSLSILNNMNPANGTWHTSAEGKARFYFASNSNTYFRTGADFIYRNNSDSGVLVIDSSGNLRTTSGGDNSPSYSLHVGGTGFAVNDFRAPIFYDSNDTGYYGDFASTSRLNILSLVSYAYINGQTLNGQSFYQWEGATYRNPGDHTPQLLIRKDNSTTGINGFAPALALYNNNGADQTTVGMTFVSAEAVSPTQGNSVELAGIIAKKESTGTAGGWSRGSLNFYTKDFGTRKDVMYMSPDGTVTVTGTDNNSGKADFSVDTGGTATMALSGQYFRVGSTDVNWAMKMQSNGYLATYGQQFDIATVSGDNAITFATNGTNRVNIGGSTTETVKITGYANYVGNYGYNTLTLIDTSGYPGLNYRSGNNNWLMRMDGGGTYSMNWSSNASAKDVGTFSTPFYFGTGGTAYASNDFRAPIFYDANDTSYYVDPNSLSNIVELKTNKNWYDSSATAWGGGINMAGNNPTIGFQSTASTWWFMLHHSSDSINFYRRSTSGGWNQDCIWDSSGNFIWRNGSIRAPIFYDFNNTSYYLDPASTSNLNVVNLVGITGAGNAYIQTTSTGTSYTSHFQIREASGGGGNTSEIYAPALGFHWSGVVASNILMESSGRIAIRNNPGSGYENFIANAIYGAVFYDSNDTTYYLDPSAATSLNIAGQITTAKTNGTLLSIAGADTIGYNSTAGRGAYIKGTGGTYVYGSGVYYDGSNIRQMLYEDTWLNNKYFGSDGIIYSAVSMRAPIFYDYNDTNYYLDPNGGSVLKNVNVNGLYPNSSTTDSDIYARDALINSYYHGDALTYDVFQFNAASLYEIKLTSTHSFSSTTVETSIFKGDRFGGMTIANNTYQVRWTWSNTIGYKFFKSLYIANSTNGNSFAVTIEYSGNGTTWTTLATSAQMSNWPGHSWFTYLWNNNAAQGYLRLTITPVWSTVYDINIYNMRYFASYNLDASVRLYDWDYSRNVTFPVSLRAPIFYDSDNTAYYVDPASASNVNNLTTAGTLYTNNIAKNANGSPIVINSGQNAALGLRVYYDMQLYNTLTFTDSSWNSQGSIFGSGGNVTINAATATTSFIKYAGYSQEGGSFRAPIFYDSDDTTYYLDPASTSLSLKTRSSILINNASSPQNLAMLNIGYNGAGETRAIDIYGGWSGGENKSISFTHGSTAADIVAQINGQHNGPGSKLRFGKLYHGGNSSTYTMELISESTTSAYLTVVGSVRSPIFYDSDNTAYYLDPNSTSNLVGLTVANTITGNIATATNLITTRTNWSTNGTITAVVGQLCWKNYGNNHTIIDASNSTSPAGGAINNTNPDVAWTGTYPTLMGWNGANTYGVRVDSCRYADQVGYSPSRTDSTAYPVLWGSGTSYTVAYSCAAVTIQSSTGTLNATNVNVSGKLVQNSTTQSITGTGQTLTLNVAAAAVQVISMASGATITTISYTNRDNNPSVNTIMLVVKYAGTASITFTNVLWANGTAPTLTGTNGYADVFMLTSYQGGAGTPVWIGTVVAQALVSTNL